MIVAVLIVCVWCWCCSGCLLVLLDFWFYFASNEYCVWMCLCLFACWCGCVVVYCGCLMSVLLFRSVVIFIRFMLRFYCLQLLFRLH